MRAAVALAGAGAGVGLALTSVLAKASLFRAAVTLHIADGQVLVLMLVKNKQKMNLVLAHRKDQVRSNTTSAFEEE